MPATSVVPCTLGIESTSSSGSVRGITDIGYPDTDTWGRSIRDPVTSGIPVRRLGPSSFTWSTNVTTMAIGYWPVATTLATQPMRLPVGCDIMAIRRMSAATADLAQGGSTRPIPVTPWDRSAGEAKKDESIGTLHMPRRLSKRRGMFLWVDLVGYALA